VFRPVVLIVVCNYPPAVKAGGPIKSIAGLTDQLRDSFSFRVVTSAWDIKERVTLSGVVPNRWLRSGRTRVLYLVPGFRTLCAMFREMARRDYQVLYLNSFFSRQHSMFPVLLWVLRVVPRHVQVVLAPRGEFSAGALRFRSRRKRLYILFARLLRLHRDERIVWQASTTLEEADILRALGPAATAAVAGALVPSADSTSSASTVGLRRPRILRASDIVSSPSPNRSLVAASRVQPAAVLTADSPPHTRPRRAKVEGEADLVFVSRISRKKNLLRALEALRGVAGRVRFWVYGPIEDEQYWRECEGMARRVDDNITVHYCGAVSNRQAIDAFAASHLFLFPTYGENFGHVIQEALAVGCPVLVGHDTPWYEIENAGAGWVLEPEDLARIRSAIQQCVAMGPEAWTRLEQAASRFTIDAGLAERAVRENRMLFQYAAKLSMNRLRQQRGPQGSDGPKMT
jgi:glycosyltransferase involved in cell wall biosynthesis